MSLTRIDLPEEKTRPAPQDAAPDLTWVPVDRLRINPAYQRPIEKRGLNNIRKIAGDFRWSRFGALDVRAIDGGLYEVIDGQHRAHAAALCGIENVPALVKVLSDTEAAAAFAAINGNVTQMTAFHVFRAARAALEPWALQCDAVAERAGCRMMTSYRSTKDKTPGQLYCITAVRQMVEAGHGDHLCAALAGLMESNVTRCVPAFSAAWVKAMTLAARNCGVTRAEVLVAFFEAVNPWDVEWRCEKLRAGDDPAYRGKPMAHLFPAALTAHLRSFVQDQMAA